MMFSAIASSETTRIDSATICGPALPSDLRGTHFVAISPSTSTINASSEKGSVTALRIGQTSVGAASTSTAGINCIALSPFLNTGDANDGAASVNDLGVQAAGPRIFI